jgi:hypothetical protein
MPANVLVSLEPKCVLGCLVLLQKAIRLLKSTETVVRTYERTKLWRDAPAMYQREWRKTETIGAMLLTAGVGACFHQQAGAGPSLG